MPSSPPPKAHGYYTSGRNSAPVFIRRNRAPFHPRSPSAFPAVNYSTPSPSRVDSPPLRPDIAVTIITPPPGQLGNSIFRSTPSWGKLLSVEHHLADMRLLVHPASPFYHPTRQRQSSDTKDEDTWMSKSSWGPVLISSVSKGMVIFSLYIRELAIPPRNGPEKVTWPGNCGCYCAEGVAMS